MRITAEQLMARPEVDAGGLPVLSDRVVQVSATGLHGVIEGIRMDGLYTVRVPADGSLHELRAHQFVVLP